MRVTVLDYGAGNLHSLCKALALAASAVRVEREPMRALRTDLLVLPGVGAFGQAASHLAPARDAIRGAVNAGLPTIGICLGMQLLLDRSEEGPGAGLAVIAGDVTRLRALRVPQIGWNTLDGATDPLLVRSGMTTPYFANGYACRPRDVGSVTAWCSHDGDRFPAVLRQGRTFGVQFHPEKSGRTGIAFLAALIEEAACS